MKVTLRQLRVFEAVVRLGSVTRAAEDLHMSQSAASTALKEFQSALDRPALFKRSGRTLIATQEARAIHALALNAINVAKDIESPEHVGELKGTIFIGATHQIAEQILPSLLNEFRRLHPQVQINLFVGGTEEIIIRLSNLDIEIALMEAVTRAPDTRMIAWRRAHWTIFTAPSHPLAKKRKITFADIERCEWAIPPRSSATNVRLVMALEGYVEKFKIAFEINNNITLREIVKGGTTIGLLPNYLIAEDVKNKLLVPLKVDRLNVESTLFIVVRTSLNRSRLFTQFMEFLEQRADK